MSVTLASNRWRVFVFPFFNVLLNGFNFLFHIIAGRYLTTEQYGQFNALLAMFTLLSVVGLSIQLVTAKLSFQGRDIVVLSKAKKISLFTTVSCFILFAFVPIISKFIQISILSYIWLIILIWLHIITSYYRGMMQGSGSLMKLNLSFYAEVGGKLLLVFFFINLTKTGLDVERLMLAVMLGMLASTIYGYMSSTSGDDRANRRNTGEKISWQQVKQDLGQSFVLNCSILFFLSIDMLAVHYFLPNQSGEYAVALKYGQLVYFAAFSIITALVPKINKALAQEGETINAKTNTITIILAGYGICIFFGLILYLLMSNVLFLPSISLFFGPEYSGVSAILLPIGIVYAILALVVFLAYLHMLSGNSRLKVWLLAGGVSIMIAFILNHRNLRQILVDEIIVYGLLSIGLFIDWLRYKNTDRANSISTEGD